jgi:hypothetical protein
MNHALNTAGIIQSWNAGADSRTGAALDLGSAPAAAPAPAADDSVPADDDHGTFVLSDDEQGDPDDPPAAWAA